MAGDGVTESEAKMEARILRTVADAIMSGYLPGYSSMGGPRDGKSSPPSFNAKQAAADLREVADEIDEIEADE